MTRALAAKGLAVVVGDPEAGAGQRFATLTVTNTGAEPHVLTEDEAFTLEAADGTARPAAARYGDPQAPDVVLQPGASVAKELRWTAVTEADDPQSGFTPAQFTLVTGTDRQVVHGDWPLGPVPDGRIETGSYRPV
ncbi:DUF4232 domain-containing protein [Actinokineospora bangkokensis]|uniref:DUF4232 domain-containing protein n=1 Tax=Actinokineospora bangkokensis TaxID=1193682 RepID=A0A1Q9LMU2_9PSEU|nr:DUF4232 domain-containing protein [Actinokineospora bangkokensis]OLR93323.1 hypothetical protein BJP25_17775 [Actinokineospora bangkokensis]